MVGNEYAPRLSAWARVCRALSVVLLTLVEMQPAVAQELRERGPEMRLRMADYDAYTFVPPQPLAGKRARPRTASIEVVYNGFSPEAREAFAYAARIWETLIESPVPIRVEATWRPLETGVLGSAGPQLVANFPGAPVRDTWYPSALAEAIGGADYSDGEPDVFASFNSELGLWYLGTDGRPPAGTFDFVSVVLHELGHGLGFVGSFSVDDGDPERDPCPLGGEGVGCWGIGQQRFPVIFDRFTEDDRENPLLDTSVYPNPSRTLADVLQSDAVFFEGLSTRAANRDIPVNLYAPGNFDLGSSYSHLDERIFPAGNLNSLMTPQLARAEAIHSPGPITCGIFRDIGWPLSDGCLALLDLGLVSFNVEARGDGVEVEWLAFNAPSTLRFEVQRRFFDDPFRTVATVPGTAVDGPADAFVVEQEGLSPGRYTFRLRQVMADGAVFLSPEVTVFVDLPEALFVSHPFPNPFTDAAHLDVLTDAAQEVTVDVFDARGVHVERLFAGVVPEQERLRLRFDAAGLAAGVYFVRVQSEGFEETFGAVLVR